MSGNAITSQYAGFAVEDLYLPSTIGMLGWRSKCRGALLWKERRQIIIVPRKL
jgi:hypothetical protein